MMASIFIGCNANEPRVGEDDFKESSTKVALSVKPEKLTIVGYATRVEYINVECNTNWRITVENEDMFSLVSPVYGDGDKKVTVYFPEVGYYDQNTFTTQHGSITISCKDENRKTISRKVECVRKKSY